MRLQNKQRSNRRKHSNRIKSQEKRYLHCNDSKMLDLAGDSEPLPKLILNKVLGLNINKLNALKSDSRAMILFYYAGLHNSDRSFAGTNSAIVSLARALAEISDGYTIHLTGHHVKREENCGKAQIIPMPTAAETSTFLADYNVVVFATHLQHFQDIPKPIGQSWILHQHCWVVEPAELTHINAFDIVIALSELHKKAIVCQGVPKEKVHVVPNGVDTNTFSPQSVKRKPRSIMFAGAVVPHKGVHLLIQAFAYVQKLFPYAQLHIYGSASMWHLNCDYEQQLKKLSVKGCFFHSPIPNRKMPGVYSRHSLLCLPSQLESFGLVTIEAQACGCIPIVHETGGVPATLIDGESGFLYGQNTPEVLSETIIKAFESIDSNPSMRSCAIDFVRTRFDITTTAKHFATLIGQLQEPESTEYTNTTGIVSQNSSELLQNNDCFRVKDIDIYRSMPVLLCYPGRRESWKSTIISENEIFCGPDCAISRGADGLKEIRTNSGIYKMSLILSNIPKHKWPELYVVRPSVNNRPVNTSTRRCARVVIIGKEFYDPLQANILAEYLKIEKFDYILIDISQVPVELFEPEAHHKPMSLFSILTGCVPSLSENIMGPSEFVPVKQKSLSVLSDIVLLGERLYSAGKIVEAMKCFTHIVTNTSDNDSRCQAFNNIGVIAHSVNDMKTAEQMFVSALQIDPVGIHALLNLSDVYLTQGIHDKALNVLKKAFDAHPGNDQISERLVLVTPPSNMKETFDTQQPVEMEIIDVSPSSVPEEYAAQSYSFPNH